MQRSLQAATRNWLVWTRTRIRILLSFLLRVPLEMISNCFIFQIYIHDESVSRHDPTKLQVFKSYPNRSWLDTLDIQVNVLKSHFFRIWSTWRCKIMGSMALGVSTGAQCLERSRGKCFTQKRQHRIRGAEIMKIFSIHIVSLISTLSPFLDRRVLSVRFCVVSVRQSLLTRVVCLLDA